MLAPGGAVDSILLN